VFFFHPFSLFPYFLFPSLPSLYPPSPPRSGLSNPAKRFSFTSPVERGEQHWQPSDTFSFSINTCTPKMRLRPSFGVFSERVWWLQMSRFCQRKSKINVHVFECTVCYRKVAYQIICDYMYFYTLFPRMGRFNTQKTASFSLVV